jgi:arylsulfatase A-like enzyme
VVRHGDLKYIHTLVDGHQRYEELYDLAADPEELDNLVPSGRCRGELDHLRAELLRWLTATELSRLHPVAENHYQVPRIAREYL